MIKKGLILFGAIFIAFSSFAQLRTTDLFMQKEIRQAYEKRTRSYTGEPGKNYFINKTDYKIKAKFNPETRLLSGSEIITYTNNSPDSLKEMYFNLYQDLYKKGNSRDWDIGTVDITDGVLINKIRFNGKDIDVKSDAVSNRQSILRIKLPNSINPKSTAKIEIEWELTFPGTVPIRMGTYEKNNFMIAYWYPKVAVYDDIVGWNTHGHSGNQEFYNDFGNFDVEITVPGDYQLWATGILQNAKDLYTTPYYNRIEKSKQTDKIIHIITEKDRKDGQIMKKAEFHTWKFKSQQTPDFAFGMSRTYYWDATSIKSGDRRISINSVYKPTSEYFKQVADIMRKTLQFFTEEIPNVPYPYPQVTDFNGGGGMEFPGMTNCGEARSLNSTIYLTAHEIGHSYFPFYTGLNEQKYAWTDEGLITFFPQFIVQKYTDDKNFVLFKRNIAAYNHSAGTYIDVPMMINTNNVGRYAYRFHSYNRPSTAFYLLYNYLGKEKFAKGLKLFTERWNGKHPMPFDFFFTFNEVAEEDLAWFWKPWFFELGYADLSIEEIKKVGKDKLDIIIKNKTGFPVPIHLTAVYKNGSTKTVNLEMNVWENETKKIKISVPAKDITKIYTNTETIPDAYPEDNSQKI